MFDYLATLRPDDRLTEIRELQLRLESAERYAVAECRNRRQWGLWCSSLARTVNPDRYGPNAPSRTGYYYQDRPTWDDIAARLGLSRAGARKRHASAEPPDRWT